MTKILVVCAGEREKEGSWLPFAICIIKDERVMQDV